MQFALPERRGLHQSLLPVYFSALLYYDTIFSFFALTLQYFLFIYKYNMLYYEASTIAGEIIILTLLLPINALRLYGGWVGVKGKRGGWLGLFLGMGVLVLIGGVYVVGLQTNALYLEYIIWLMEIIMLAVGIVYGLIVLIVYCCEQ